MNKMNTKNWKVILILSTSPLFIVLAIVVSVLYGVKDIGILTIWQAITHFDANNVDHNIIMTSRFPRNRRFISWSGSGCFRGVNAGGYT